jgi:outer membrane protein assembly factor BamB
MGPDDAGIAWQYQSYRAVWSNPAVDAGGRVYVADNTGAICLGPDGGLIWKTSLGLCKEGGLAIGPGPQGETQVYFGTRDPWIFWCLGAQDGRVRWQISLPGPADGPPAVDPAGNVWFGCDDGLLRVCTPGGTVAKTIALGGPIRSAPAFDHGGTVYVATFAGRLVALDQSDQILWERALGCTTRSAPVVGGDGRIYVGDNLGRAWCFLPDGQTGYQAQLHGIIGCAALDAAGNSFFPSSDGNLYALDPSGQLRWSFKSPGSLRTYAPPIIDAAGRAFVGASDGWLRSVGPDGVLLWQLYLYSEPGALAATADGAVIVGTATGRIVRTVSGSPAPPAPQPDPDPVPGPPGIPTPAWPPSITVAGSQGAGGWYTSAPVLVVDPFPDDPWPDGAILRWQAGNQEGECGAVSGKPAAISPQAQGQYELAFWLEAAGQTLCGPMTWPLKVDVSPPSVQLHALAPGAIVQAGLPIDPGLVVADPESGVSDLAVTMDGEEWTPGGQVPAGVHTLTVVCENHAGLATQISTEFTAVELTCSALALNPVLVSSGQGLHRAPWGRWITVMVRVPAAIASGGPPANAALAGVTGTMVAKFPAHRANAQRPFLVRFDREAIQAAVTSSPYLPMEGNKRLYRVTLSMTWSCGAIPCQTNVDFIYIPRVSN